MTVTIDVPDEVADSVRAAAEARGEIFEAAGLSIAEEIANVLRQHLVAARTSQTAPLIQPGTGNPIPWDEFFALMVEGVDPNIPPLSDYAVSREGIYEDHL